jgi:hypothetical protein
MAVSVIRTRSARDYHTQQEHFLYRKIAWNTPGITSTHCYVGVLPAHAQPLETIVRVTSAFAQGVVVGTTANGSAYVSAADLAEGSTGVTIVDRCVSAAYSSVDLPIHVRMSTADTAGEADIWVRYLTAK